MAELLTGIDISYDSLKAIGLTKLGAGRYRLVGMNVAPIPANCWTTTELKNREEIAKVLQESFKAAKPRPLTARRIMLALPESVFSSGTFSVPTMKPGELKQALPYQIAEKLSVNLDDHYIDYELTNSRCKPIEGAEHRSSNPSLPPEKTADATKKDPGQPSAEDTLSDHTAVFAVAAKKSLIDSLIELGKMANVEIAGIDIKPGAVARAVAPAHDQTMRLIVDLGASNTVVIVAEGHSPHLMSSVPIGVKSISATEVSAAGHTVATPLGPDPHALEHFLAKAGPVFDELVHVTKFYENRICPGGKIIEILLTGGGANIHGIAELFSQQTGLPTKLGKPFTSIDTAHYPVSVDLAQTFADSVGLAMRDLHEENRRLG